MMTLKYAKGRRNHLSHKLINRLNLNQTDVDLYLAKLLDEITNDSSILYDFEAIDYSRSRILVLRKDKV